jgi:hypothetical protein
MMSAHGKPEGPEEMERKRAARSARFCGQGASLLLLVFFWGGGGSSCWASRAHFGASSGPPWWCRRGAPKTDRQPRGTVVVRPRRTDSQRAARCALLCGGGGGGLRSPPLPLRPGGGGSCLGIPSAFLGLGFLGLIGQQATARQGDAGAVASHGPHPLVVSGVARPSFLFFPLFFFCLLA